MHSEPRQPLPARKRLLLVDDDAPVRRAMQLLLQSHGFDVRAYGSPAGLAQQKEALAASCLIADLMLAISNGINLLIELRAAGWQGRALLISGHLNQDWIDHGIAQGFDAVLAKPVPGNVLVATVKRLVH